MGHSFRLELGNGIYVSISMNGSDTPVTRPETDNAGLSSQDMGYSFRLAARVLLYAPSHRQDSTYHDLCYTSRGVLAGTRNSSMGPSHEGSIRRPKVP